MRQSLLIIAFALLLAGCGGGGGGNGEEEGSGFGETAASVPEGTRAGSGAPSGPLGEGQESLVIDMGGKGTVIVENVGFGETSVTAEVEATGKLTIRAGTCASPGKVVEDLGATAPGFTQVLVTKPFETFVKTPHVVMIGEKLCGEIKAAAS
jgi:hypothetical protein